MKTKEMVSDRHAPFRVNVANGARAFARMVQGVVRLAFQSADTTDILFCV
jgi:hypothetical protein